MCAAYMSRRHRAEHGLTTQIAWLASSIASVAWQAVFEGTVGKDAAALARLTEVRQGVSTAATLSESAVTAPCDAGMSSIRRDCCVFPSCQDDMKFLFA